jgi:uncharacterized protein YpmB
MRNMLDTWGHTARFIVIITISFISVLLLFSIFFARMDFDIKATNDKTLVTIVERKFNTKQIAATSVLSASDCWANTGIEIRPDETYIIKVSGKVHASGEKLLMAASNDSIPTFGWMGPAGLEYKPRVGEQYKEADSIRKQLLLTPKANIGAVLFYFQYEGEKQPNCQIGNDMYLPQEVITYNTQQGLTGTNSTGKKIYVWASVNDMLIRDMDSEASRTAYLGGKNKQEKRKQTWKALQKANYNRLWFDDNLGNFIISAAITKPFSLNIAK